MQTDLVVIPSSYLEIDGDDVYSTKAIDDFVADAATHGIQVKIATSAEGFQAGSQQDFPISRHANLEFIKLCEGNNNRSKAGKLLSYATALLNLIFQVPRTSLWYLFIPGRLGLLAGLVRCILRRPFALYLRGEWPTTGLRGRIHLLLFRKATFIITTGEAFAKMVSPLNAQVTEVAPMMRFTKQDLLDRESYAITGVPRILFVGALWPEKGILDVIQAVSLLARECPVELQIVGSGSAEQLEVVRAEVSNSSCPDNISMLGFVGDKQSLRSLFISADIFTFPTYYAEGFPRVVYEAMTFGLPVISTDFPGGRCLLRDSENCKIVPARAPETLADCLLTLLKNETLRAKLGSAGQVDAKSLYEKFDGVTHASQVANHLVKLPLE
jgi:glycosyltransferase involved in cell wall biosynthesis